MTKLQIAVLAILLLLQPLTTVLLLQAAHASPPPGLSLDELVELHDNY